MLVAAFVVALPVYLIAVPIIMYVANFAKLCYSGCVGFKNLFINLRGVIAFM